jgi:hypothetical protein
MGDHSRGRVAARVRRRRPGMRRVRPAFAFALVTVAVSLLPVLIRAQQAGAPSAQANVAQPLNMAIPQVNGTGAISGVVTDAATKKPIAGVVVYLGPPNRGPVGEPTQQVSDAQGRFVFRDLPPSEAYFINASKPATSTATLDVRLAVSSAPAFPSLRANG